MGQIQSYICVFSRWRRTAGLADIPFIWSVLVGNQSAFTSRDGVFSGHFLFDGGI